MVKQFYNPAVKSRPLHVDRFRHTNPPDFHHDYLHFLAWSFGAYFEPGKLN